ncbi:spore germination protein [Metabacillus halosaccharovorans]|uniref:Spore germination protein n=1 Tax=Metabacillus halosaccharovorans TaxID=930124 RepID=A0ABT3DFJ8_9BACI|nr:spore germination protein [Metabacillus halosaccharovorans]MCV9885714.1 spore germination protein [Metabacillus halosaccharovorans]
MIQSSLKENLFEIKELFGNSSDLKIRELLLNGNHTKIAIVYIDGIADDEKVEEQIITPISLFSPSTHQSPSQLIELFLNHVIKTNHVIKITDIQTLADNLVNGNTMILIDNHREGLCTNTSKMPERSLTPPVAQRTPTGPNISFNESLTSNISLVRNYIKDPMLRVDNSPLQGQSKTSVSVVYLEGKVDKEILNNVYKKLKEVKIDIILDSNYIVEVITAETKSLFPLTFMTDRPDVIAAELMGGKVIIFVDGTPFALALPAVLIQLFQSPDDYYTMQKGIQKIRIVRIFFFFLSVLLPAFYIAFTIYHPGLVPTQLLVGILAQREFVPFPTIIEVLVFYWLILIITESSLRLPQGVVLTVTIFASITLGQQAVEAQLVQPTTLVVLGASYVMSSVVPTYSLSTVSRILTFRFIFLSSFLGLFGIMVGLVALLIHLCSLRSFGVPYLSPMAPFNLKDQKDAIIRKPIQDITSNEKAFKKEEPMKKRD